MLGSTQLISLVLVIVTCAIAVLLARRWQLRLAPAWLAGTGWSISCLVAHHLILSSWPPIPWSPAALDAEPWESLVIPLALLCAVWPFIYEYSKQWPRISLLIVLLVGSFPILAALSQAERYAPMFVGNTAWAMSALGALAVNFLVMERLQKSGADRWCLWIIVGQTLSVAAVIMTCYGRFGEWAAVAGLSLAIVAFARVLIADADAAWSVHIGLPALVLSSALVMHIREYRSNPLPYWFTPLPFLIPTLVAAVDIAWSSKWHVALRVLVAGVITAGLGAATIAIVLAINGPSEW